MIIVPITAHSEKEALKQIKEANRTADTIEIRADLLERQVDLKKLLAKCLKPRIVTYRSRKEGGKFFGTPEKMAELIMKAIELKPEFVDIEYSIEKELRDKLIKKAKKKRVKVILSKHDTKETLRLAKARELFSNMAKKKPFAIKIVTFARKASDNTVPIALFAQAREKDKLQLISFCMGEKGLFSRIVSEVLGFGTFASLGKGKESAPGQIEAKKMRQIIRGLTHAKA